jgi:hypothetical protein
VVFSTLLISLYVSFIAALFLKGERRAFWVGYLSAGAAYAVMNFGPWFADHVSPFLITTTVIDLVYPLMPPLPLVANGSPWERLTGAPINHGFFPLRNGMPVNTPEAFLRLGHSLFAILASVAGGFLARRFYRTRG